MHTFHACVSLVKKTRAALCRDLIFAMLILQKIEGMARILCVVSKHLKPALGNHCSSCAIVFIAAHFPVHSANFWYCYTDFADNCGQAQLASAMLELALSSIKQLLHRLSIAVYNIEHNIEHNRLMFHNALGTAPSYCSKSHGVV